jgi:hypothetical protein
MIVRGDSSITRGSGREGEGERQLSSSSHSISAPAPLSLSLSPFNSARVCVTCVRTDDHRLQSPSHFLSGPANVRTAGRK